MPRVIGHNNDLQLRGKQAWSQAREVAVQQEAGRLHEAKTREQQLLVSEMKKVLSIKVVFDPEEQGRGRENLLPSIEIEGITFWVLDRRYETLLRASIPCTECDGALGRDIREVADVGSLLEGEHESHTHYYEEGSSKRPLLPQLLASPLIPPADEGYELFCKYMERWNARGAR